MPSQGFGSLQLIGRRTSHKDTGRASELESSVKEPLRLLEWSMTVSSAPIDLQTQCIHHTFLYAYTTHTKNSLKKSTAFLTDSSLIFRSCRVSETHCRTANSPRRC